jgi:hypothetical protein
MKTYIKHKTSKLAFLGSAVLFALIISIVGCNKQSDPVGISSDDVLYSATLPDAISNPSDLSDATTVAEATIAPPSTDVKRVDDFGFRGLRGLRKQLNLTPAQRLQIRELHKQHEQCFKTTLETLRASEKAIVQSYKPQYQAIKDNLKNGVIDSATAKTQFKALSQSLRDELKNNPQLAIARDQFKTCRNTFFDSVRGVLTDEQIAIFEEWAESHRRK